MKIPEDVINEQAERVQSLFRYWEPYMENHVDFWDIPGSLDIHTQGHCERVLMHALRIGEARHFADEEMQALSLASIFHDTRRKDNYLDTGHGARAAEHLKKAFPSTDDMRSVLSKIEDGREYTDSQLALIRKMAYAAVFFHDRDDVLGEKYIRQHFAEGIERDEAMEVYHIFKDADALDRLRLGEWCLDPEFLRTKEAKGMQPFAQNLVEVTTPGDELMKTYKTMEPFRPKH